MNPSAWATHEISNQVPVLRDYNLFESDSALREAVAHAGAAWHATALSRCGAQLGGGEAMRLGELANRHAPELASYDRNGERVDRVEFHPAWDALMAMLYAEGVHCSPWREPRAGAHAARAAAFFLHGQIEAGSLCPTTMTFAAIPLLMREPALFSALREKLFAPCFDARDLPLDAKQSALVGMGLTEKQGGSDLRGTSTVARRCGANEYALVGHKWFLSAPSADAHLVLARADEGLTCFYVPRWLPQGGRNAIRIQRLKDKLGNRSNATAEVEFMDAFGIAIGTPGRGIATAIEMAAQTRLDCVLGSAALLRQALVQALHHARHRSAFGRPLLEQPLMRALLVDLALESEAATWLALRLAGACERADQDAFERALWRIVTPAAKFWICKRAIAACAECMEIVGGNGYVEESPLARLFREAPVNSIWEGAGNVMCLDMLRGMKREPASAQALADALLRHATDDPLLAAPVRDLVQKLGAEDRPEAESRWMAQQLVLLVQSMLLVEAAPRYVAEAFLKSRLGRSGGVFGAGTPPAAPAASQILARAWPQP